MNKNSNFNRAKKIKNDEFYTQLSDIDNELKYYKEHFKGKIVFCNCDNPELSNFWKYFLLNFDYFELKKLISTHYEQNNPSYKIECNGEKDKQGNLITITSKLLGNGDFRSPECVALLKESDIVVSNPPFSLFREYINLLIENSISFIVIGNLNAITYKNIFKQIKENKIWLGITSPKEFKEPNGSIKKFGNIIWFTNLNHQKRNEELILYKNYYGKEFEYTKYDNYNAININKIKDIPYDYKETMGVPITFLKKYNPEQFEICGTQRWFYNPSLGITNGKLLINGKEIYDRIFIKRLNKNSKNKI
jgi:hypothetical protein